MIIRWEREQIYFVIYPLVDISAILREGIVRPAPLDVHQMEQARAVCEFNQHPDREKIRS